MLGDLGVSAWGFRFGCLGVLIVSAWGFWLDQIKNRFIKQTMVSDGFSVILALGFFEKHRFLLGSGSV